MKNWNKLILVFACALLSIVGCLFVDVKEVSADTGYTITFDYNTENLSGYIPSNIKNIKDVTYILADGYAYEPSDNVVSQKLTTLTMYYNYEWMVGGQVIELGSYPINCDTTFVARWTPRNYMIYYMYRSEKEKNEITNLQFNKSYNIESGDVLYYTPIRPNYVFDGWGSLNATNKSTYLKAGSFGDVILYPYWQPIAYVINYHTDADNPDNPKYYNIESDFELTKPYKTGYIFKGWFLDKKFKTPITKISTGTTGNLDLYPLWEKEEYNVTYIMEDGSSQIIKTKYGETASLPKINKTIFDILILDESRKCITGDTTINVKVKSIWYVYVISLVIILSIVAIIIGLKIKKRQQINRLRYYYQSNRKNKR